MEVDGLDGEETEEDELHIASLEADADEDFGGEEVGDPEFEEEFHDNRTGEYLDPELVAKARSEEVEFMAKIGLYQDVDITECLEITGRPPISTRWVDENKGSMESLNVRCRHVARDFKPKGEKIDRTSSPQCLRWRRRSSYSERRSEGERSCGTGNGASRRSC